MSATEKVAYLKGLLEGLSVDAGSNEGKVYAAIVDVLADLAEEMEALEQQVDELDAAFDEIDEDLGELESEFYDDDDEDEWDSAFYDITCPACKEEFSVDEETLLEGGIDCPSCGERLEFEVDCDDEDCGCGCNHE